MRNLLHHIVGLPATLMIALITAYQHTLSPDHGPLKHLSTYGYCRHSPTCSEYAKQVIRERGVMMGIPMSVWRVLRCNPFSTIDDQRIQNVLEKTV